MSGVWVFKNGVVRLVENPGNNQGGGGRAGGPGGIRRRKVLVHVPTNEVICSYDMLERKLGELGWERYGAGDPSLLQFHKRTSVHLISLPRDFSRLGTVHMYDIVVKSRNVFEVRDA
ncbi:Flowering-promoting factor 1-like protein 3 [Platanthera zijinensis]|uniref:Flowering-promoting factor 1-like protein 3 n=1 Tax=Platanthera zijinensis TaxID=2320716 RepID=A0AAP0FVR8_9ASPA